jgi:hypothetical protein
MRLTMWGINLIFLLHFKSKNEDLKLEMGIVNILYKSAVK